jgi:hypothetical protein
MNRIRSLEGIVKGLRSTVRASLACADLAKQGLQPLRVLRTRFCPTFTVIYRGGEYWREVSKR